MKALLVLIPLVVGCQTPTGPDQHVWDVSGTVQGPSGPVANAAVRFVGVSEGGWFGGSGGEFAVQVISDTDGRFSFHMVTPGCHANHSLTAEHPDYYQVHYQVLPDSRSVCPDGIAGVMIRLEPLGTLGITTTVAPRATIDLEYSFALEAVGSIFTPSSPSWSIVEGSLPPGLNLTSWGEIRGTPTSTGTWGFTVEAVTRDTRPARVALSLEVAPRPSGPGTSPGAETPAVRG